MTGFSGLIPPICTPVDAGGQVDTSSLANLVEFQISAGASGIFILGSSGEAIYLTDDERLVVAQTASAVVGNRVPLLVGALAPSPRRVAQQMQMLRSVDAQAYVVTAPFYAKLSDDEVKEHFRTASAAAGRPVLAYDIPGNVGTKIPGRVAAELLQDGTLAGLKDSSGDTEGFSWLLQELGAPRAAALLSGSDTNALNTVTEGADGLIPGLSNVRPGYFTGLLEAVRQGDNRTATAYQEAITILNGIFRVGVQFGLGRHASEIGALKHVLALDGVISTAATGTPLTALPPEARDMVAALVRAADQVVRQASTATTESKQENHD